MQRLITQPVLDAIQAAVDAALSRDGMVNVPAVAAAVQKAHEDANIALEDLEEKVMALAIGRNAVIVFHRPETLPDAAANGSGHANGHRRLRS
ncbi:hypothetical protein N1F89_18240 [Aquibium sp. A9E412]|uniref:hypothetical protein n=1 Tax=Aquibium sp. A9E412 TaxID=2976767 RepID=UPI0025B27928|nr:hypothetical protein [Aquibium sp. A9E412]MDN2568168.1 hypothetical protein [Aquibium sp. A9E412]